MPAQNPSDHFRNCLLDACLPKVRAHRNKCKKITSWEEVCVELRRRCQPADRELANGDTPRQILVKMRRSHATFNRKPYYPKLEELVRLWPGDGQRNPRNVQRRAPNANVARAPVPAARNNDNDRPVRVLFQRVDRIEQQMNDDRENNRRAFDDFRQELGELRAEQVNTTKEVREFTGQVRAMLQDEFKKFASTHNISSSAQARARPHHAYDSNRPSTSGHRY